MSANPKSLAGYDVERVRRDFPILAREVHGKPLVFLDSAASSQRPASVIGAVDEYERLHHANVHRGVHQLSQEATAMFEQARERVRRFVNAASTREVIFTRGTTESINLVAQGWAARRLPLMRRLGVAGTVRASLQVYSTRTEVDALVTAVDAARGALA